MSVGVIFDFNRTLYDPDTDKLVEGCIEVLEDLTSKGYRLCLISTRTEEDREEQIKRLGLARFFVHIQVIDGEKTEENFRLALEKLGSEPGEVYVVGDRIQGELLIGNQLGMITVWFRNGKFANVLPANDDQAPFFIIWRLDHLPCIIG